MSRRSFVWLAAMTALALVFGIGLRFLLSPSSPPGLPLAFVARHEHGFGHCTGELSLAEAGVVFRTSRHGEWRWRADEIVDISRPSETELELRARSRERGRSEDIETFRFTFLRPAISREDFQRFRSGVLGLEGALR